jgi:hypothetical protein
MRIGSRSLKELLTLKTKKSRALVEGMITTPGLTMVVATKKTGKTTLLFQACVSVAAGTSLWGCKRVFEPGPTLYIAKDDQNADDSLQQLALKSPIIRQQGDSVPFRWDVKQWELGPDFLESLRTEIREQGLKMVVLDSWTALRGPRKPGSDIVKLESAELLTLDSLAREMDCAIVLLHHISHGNRSKEWSERAGGTYAVGHAYQTAIFIDKIPDLGIGAPQRLVRIEGRHTGESAHVLRFRAETLDYEHIFEGDAAQFWPEVIALRNEFVQQPFSPKDVMEKMGGSRQTITRLLNRLVAGGAIQRNGYGNYSIATDIN